MARFPVRRPSHTTVVAYLALFVAVGGGTAFAVVGANQVNSASIIDGQVKNQDLAPNSVGTGKVIDNTLTGEPTTSPPVRSARVSSARAPS